MMTINRNTVLFGYNLNKILYNSYMGIKSYRNLHSSVERIKPRLFGHATSEGTLKFMESSVWTLHHHFRRSNLYINPIIHGPPKLLNLMKGNNHDHNFAKALLLHRSNCLFVYDHRPSKPWYTSMLHELVSPEYGISREGVVTIAGLGLISNPIEISQRINEAKRLTGLEYIDFAMIEFSSEVICETEPNQLISCLKEIEEIAESNEILGYGIRINVPPYCFHTPAPSTKSKQMLFQFNMEIEMENSLKKAEMVIYNISPSHQIPATYPMLTDNEEYIDENAIEDEMQRSFTRVSYDPFICLSGFGKMNAEGEAVEEEEIDLTDASEIDDGIIANDSLILNDKHHVDYTQEDLDSYKVSDGDIEIIEAPSVNSKNDLESMRNNNIENNKPFSQVGGDESCPLILVSNVMPVDVEETIAKSLDELCPALSTTPSLQDKALRIVFSVGVDAVIVDSELSAIMGALELKPEDLIDSDETDDVFGVFCVPT